MTRRVSRISYAVIFGVLIPLCAFLAVRSGIDADPDVVPAEYSQFEGLSSPETWQAIETLAFWQIPLEPPANYIVEYQSMNGMGDTDLRNALHELIDDHVSFRYTHGTKPGDSNHQVDVWDIIALADEHPESEGKVLDIYLNDTFDRQLAGPKTSPRYDREHSWPKSLGFPDDRAANPAYSDGHHLFAAYNSYNSSRSNKPYGESDNNADDRKPTLENLGQGGGYMDEPDSSNYSYRDYWQTWLGRRGDVARAMFYMAIRYEGGSNEADLELTNDRSLVIARDVWETGGKAYMGILEVLLKWHREDPVDDLERRRNSVVYLFQGNRNPFIDHPELVETVFGAGPTTSPTTTTSIWINELHYDNQGADSGEFVEIAGTAGASLNGWKLIGYNGSGGQMYETVNLGGVIPDLANGFGMLAFPFEPFQNGAPDGIALIDSNGTVVQFLSYEGSFTGAEGPCKGMISSEIGVEESGSTSVGDSLQLTGSGHEYSDFSWAAPGQSTEGAANAGQTMGE